MDLYEVVIVKHGTRSTVRSDVYLNYGLYNEADDTISMDYFFWVARNSERTIVIDTGYSEQGALARKRDVLISPPDAFAALGITAESAPDVIITHAHYDHAGNIGFFPRSQVVISQKEYDFWTSANAQRAQFHHSIEDVELEQLAAVAAQGRMTTFADRYEVAPGIEVIAVGGHTPGQSVVTVATAEGTVLLASDSMHYYEEYERDMPFTYVADLIGMYEAFDRIRALGDAGEYAHLVAGHDPSTLGRFTPVTEGALAGLAATIGSAS
jgi:glyoxylase-like metal-dependent hydrolase (beta-lactamase superfamily II)